MISKRNLLRGLFATPAIIAIDRLMPIKLIVPHNPLLARYKGMVVSESAFYYCPYIPLKVVNSEKVMDYLVKYDHIPPFKTRI